MNVFVYNRDHQIMKVVYSDVLGKFTEINLIVSPTKLAVQSLLLLLIFLK